MDSTDRAGGSPGGATGGGKTLPSRIQFSQSMRQEEEADNVPLVRDHALIPREERKDGAPVQVCARSGGGWWGFGFGLGE